MEIFGDENLQNILHNIWISFEVVVCFKKSLYRGNELRIEWVIDVQKVEQPWLDKGCFKPSKRATLLYSKL